MGNDAKEYKKYDTDCFVTYSGARLCKDPETRDGEHGKMVRLTVVATSRKPNYSDLWLEINVGDFNAEAASFLAKGDVLHRIYGRLCLRKFGDNDEKFSVIVDRADLTIPPTLFAELKERGFTPGQKSEGKKTDGKKTAKPADKKKVASKKPTPVEIPDDDDDDEDDTDEDE